MLKTFKSYCMLALWFLCPLAWAGAGELFHVTETGTAADLSFNLCLNGEGPTSCQAYQASALNLSILSTTANHTYPSAGIKLNTTGYRLSNCTLASNGYCLFSVSDTVAKSIPVQSNTATTTLSVGTGTLVISVNADTSHLIVTNTGSAIAFNVSARLPSEWTGVSQDSSDCSTIAPMESCDLRFTSTLPYVAVANASVTGDNIASPPTVAVAFSIHDYLVYAIASNSTAEVVMGSDISTSDGIAWSLTNNSIPGITETSTNPPSACDGALDGSCNTQQIVNYYTGTPLSSYAAGLCYGITQDSSGAVAQGTWYLPAICQINSNANNGGSDSHSGCSLSTPSIYTNLYSLGFLPELSQGGSVESIGNYWASTECSLASGVDCLDTTHAWAQNFGGENNAFSAPKDFALGVRCVRTIAY